MISLAFVVLAIVYVFTVKPIYEVRAMIEMGMLEAGTKDAKSLDNVIDMKQKLEYIYGIKSEKKRAFPRVKRIVLNKHSKNVFSIVVEGRNNDEVKAFISKILNKIEKEYSSQLRSYIDTKKELIALMQGDILAAEKNLHLNEITLNKYSQKLMNLTKSDAALAGIYTIQMSQNQTQVQAIQATISRLKEKMYNLKLMLTPLRIKKTHVIGQMEVYDKPVKPKKVLIVVVSFITGLMFSLFVIFFLEFMKGLSREKELEIKYK